MAILLTPGQAGDNPQLFNVLDAISVNLPGPGRPRKRPDMLIAAKVYPRVHPRRAASARHCPHHPRAIRPDRGPRDHGQSWRTPPPAFDRGIYRERNQVERCFNRLKQWRDLATRHAKRAATTAPASSSSPRCSGLDDRRARVMRP
ncbi:transposase [Micromonospora sp. IBHARD004]|uniref:transposase n=1 Tax=Micromonospora sp. IBHARD004 TaxID=3457764 RepID=UPI0040590581